MSPLFKSLILFYLLILFNHIKGQEVYRTQSGDMLITTIASDSVLKILTKDLVVILNYDNAEFIMKMDKSTFHTGIDSLDKKMALMKYDIITFNGKLAIENINTEGHPPLDFVVEGIISTNNKTIRGSGHLEHISNRGTISCLLTLKFNINKNDLGLDVGDLNLKDEIQIEIVQVVLNKH